MIDKKGMILGTVIGILLGAGVVAAESIWHQKIICKVTSPRTISVNFIPSNLDFGKCEINETVSRQIEIQNKNDYIIELMWTDASTTLGIITTGQVETRMEYESGTEIVKDADTIVMQPYADVKVVYYITNISAKAQAGSDITYTWTLKFYIEG